MEASGQAIPKRRVLEDVPRYYEPYVNDCFYNAYGALLQRKGINPALALADYLSFMYDPDSEYIGVNFLNHASATFYFTEEELNSSMAYGYLPATSAYLEGKAVSAVDAEHFQIRLYTHEDPQVAHDRLKQLIDEGEAVIVVVNLYEISYHRAYKQQHGVHAVVITGYDLEEGVYYLFDKYTMSSSDFDGTLPIEEVVAGRTTPSVTVNPVSGTTVRPMENLWMELHLHPSFRLTELLAKELVLGSCRRMRGEEEVLGQVCGFRALDAFITALHAKLEKPIEQEDRNQFRFYYNSAWKSVARQRKRFLAFLTAARTEFGWSLEESAEECLKEASMRYDIVANLALKFGLTGKPQLLVDMAEQLVLAREAEERLVAWLETLA
ncbi:BtrH N-terminal domain-containing protein [Gorillibacterium timonense]|uniref:BtrH N-terminal domain-containing protein n=1 Tax=Gorillibacterium timonense TaxID=1689269 RepID=UPI00071DE564|nr:BtrH N-terminal domain-containing protein [Gorillibacterium timonense]